MSKSSVTTPGVRTGRSSEKYATEFFDPSAAQVAAALGLVLLGDAITALVARFGSDEAEASEAEAASKASQR